MYRRTELQQAATYDKVIVLRSVASNFPKVESHRHKCVSAQSHVFRDDVATAMNIISPRTRWLQAVKATSRATICQTRSLVMKLGSLRYSGCVNDLSIHSTLEIIAACVSCAL